LRIGIIGGGLAGLVAGYSLAGDHEVIIFEQESDLGGLLSSYRNNQYSIEQFYHHFFSGDTTFMNLLDELGLTGDIIWLSGSTGSYVNGNIYPLTSPLEIIQYPFLSLLDKFRLGIFTKQASRIDIAPLDVITARDFVESRLGERIYHSFFEPLLKSKFGQNADLVSAAWLISRVAIRSDRGVSGEHLGYIKGGFSVFIDRLIRFARERGCQIRNGNPVTSVVQITSSSKAGWEINGEFFDIVIGTVSPRILQGLGVPGIPSIPYQGAACLTLALTRDVTKGIYWLNITDPAPYGAVVSHTNFAPFEWYGEHIVYLASYFSGEPDPAIQEKMLSDFCTKFSVDPGEIRWSRIAIDSEAGPLYLTGYRDHLTNPTVPGLFLAGMFSPENYPERSIEGSVRAAKRVVEGIRNCE
jgi:protoporphyrinogen oxidase